LGWAIMTPMFTACRKFGPQFRESWSRYIEWSGFRHINELVSTDSILCPSLIDSLIDADWEFNIHEDNRVFFFRDYEYLKRRINYDSSRQNLLAISERPAFAPEPIEGFAFCGYDILDSDGSISVLTNCGAFPSIYTADDLNQFGLITDLDRVTQIAELIRDTNASDHHCCDCRVLGIARYASAK
jgi:hypothetical protein